MGIIIRNTNQGGRITFRSLGLGGRITSGWPVVSPSALLLDLYPGAAAAYSVRKLSSTYNGSAIRVRRSSDNTEQNIGFINGQLDTSTLLSFCGAGNGFVTTWYDQSGNSRNAIQVTAGLQARIVNAGVITYQNSKPVIDFYGAGIFYTYTPITATGNSSLYIVQKRNTVTTGIIISSTSGGPYLGQNGDGNLYIQRVTGASGFYRSAADSSTTFSIIEGYTISNVMSAYKNNVAYSLSTELSFGSSNGSFNSIGAYGGVGSSVGYALEVIIYANDQTTNRAGINTNINSYYTIY
jgi:hypothetical protein